MASLGAKLGRLTRRAVKVASQKSVKATKSLGRNLKDFSEEVGLTSAVRSGIQKFAGWTHGRD